MEHHANVLVQIKDKKLDRLQKMFEDFLPRTSHICNFLDKIIKSKRRKPSADYSVKIMAPGGRWDDGTFVAFIEWVSLDVIIFTLEKSCQRLYETLSKTDLIDWTDTKLLIYAIHELHYPIITKIINDIDYPIKLNISSGNIWWLPKEKAQKLNTEVPANTYLQKLNRENAQVISKLWLENKKNSEDYLMRFIDMNGGYGIFLKMNNAPIAWVLKNHLDMLSTVHIIGNYTRGDYLSLVIKKVVKDIANEDRYPLGIVGQDGVFRSALKKLGFQQSDKVFFCEAPDCFLL